MDNKGFIFTTDATLALIVVMVLTTSFVTYQMLPVSMGSDHQHLEAIADSALAVMEQDGTLYWAAANASLGNKENAEQILDKRLQTLIPSGVAYKLTLKANTTVNVTDDRGITVSRDTVTKVKVISGPKEGWMGRAWYKVENFTMVQQEQNVTTTLWNFHNWLTNFAPWRVTSSGRPTKYYNGLYQQPYWGGGTTSQNIQFSIPHGATIHGLKFLVGSDNRTGGSSYGVNVNVNGVNNIVNPNSFTFLNKRPGTSESMYNYQGLITTGLSNGINNFYVKFRNMFTNGDIYDGDDRRRYDMAWFALIGNYTTSFPVPQGILSSTYNFQDAAGLAVPNAQNLGGGGGEYGRIYNLNTGTVNSFTTRRVIDWDDMRNHNHGFDDGTPFVITGVPGVTGTGHGSAVSIVKNIDVPSGNKVFDAFAMINAYGGVDSGLVEVWNNETNEWRTIFCSFDVDGVDYSDENDGYGNIPGIIYIPPEYLIPGGQNKVRITIWDDVPSSDYDLVGLVNCYVTTIYSRMNVNWENFPYRSHQDDDSTEIQTRSFTINENPPARGVLLFVGAGTDSRHIKVEYPGGAVLYEGDTIPYYLDIAALDAEGPHRITTSTSTPSNYTLKDGTFDLKVTVTGPDNAWESGDNNRNAEIFSGMRIAVLYPEALDNLWVAEYDIDAKTAMDKANASLIHELGLDPNDPNDQDEINSIKTEALYTGDLPNQISVRLELWKQ